MCFLGNPISINCFTMGIGGSGLGSGFLDTSTAKGVCLLIFLGLLLLLSVIGLVEDSLRGLCTSETKN